MRHWNQRLISGISGLVFGLFVLIFYYVNLVDIIKVEWLKTLLRAVFILIVVIVLIKRSFTKTAVRAVLVMAPLVVIILGQAGWAIVKEINNPNEAAYANGFLAIETSSSPNQQSPRVVWLILDKISQKSITLNQQINPRFPEFNRLRQQALLAEKAEPPGGGTLVAIPALFTGRRVIKARIKNATDLMLTYQGETTPVSWRSQPSIFSQARVHHWNAALVGWHHPYSRIYWDQVAFCTWNTWTEKYYDIGANHDSLLVNIMVQVRGLIPLQHKKHHVKNYQDTLNNTLKLVSDPRFNLIVVHLPVPHPPYIFDQATGRLSTNGKHSYFENLLLTDQTLTTIRQTMTQKDLWERTTLVVSADHANQPDKETGSERVPFMIKLAGQRQPLTYSRPFNTVLTKDLILAIMERKITTEAGLVEWLDRQAQ